MKHIDRLIYRGGTDEAITRHNNAIATYALDSKGLAILSMVRSWLRYADFFQVNFSTNIGNDYYAGPEWARMGKSLLALLNIDTGRYLSCMAMDHAIREAMEAEGFDPDMVT